MSYPSLKLPVKYLKIALRLAIYPRRHLKLPPDAVAHFRDGGVLEIDHWVFWFDDPEKQDKRDEMVDKIMRW